MSAVLLVPRRAGEPYRDASWHWNRARWEELLGSDCSIVEGEHDDGGPFNRSAAINAAARAAGDWTVALIVDGDAFVSSRQAIAAINAAARTGELVLGYELYKKLNRSGSEKIMSGYAGSWEAFVTTTLTDSCSSAVAVRRDLWDAVDGFDEGFVGWGWEDVAFVIACTGYAGRRRIPGDLWHLWHPRSAERQEKSPTFPANKARAARYKQARKDPGAVRALLEELKA